MLKKVYAGILFSIYYGLLYPFFLVKSMVITLKKEEEQD